ncbi:MerR family transcriptional regulator [Macrococcus animalis]|uniref:MerR family transcriptional regulator n=1 Tax=Macrococcus animalis TaxID=3395467 RepID=UPI0039BE2591
MRIGELSKLINISKDTIRYYEKLGLITPEIINNKRTYNQQDFERLQSIQILKTAQFTLNEIKIFIDLDDQLDTLEKIMEMSEEDNKMIKTLINKKLNDITKIKSEIEVAKKVLEKMKLKMGEIK